MEAEDYWQTFYPDSPYNANYFRRLMSDLFTELQEFLAWKMIKGHTNVQRNTLAAAIQANGWEEEATPLIRKWAKDRSDHPASLAELDLKGLAAQISAIDELQSAGRKATTLFQEAFDALDAPFVIRKLKYACSALNYDRVHGTRHNLGMLTLLLAHVAPRIQEYPLLAQMYFHCYQTLSGISPEYHYQQQKGLLEQFVSGPDFPVRNDGPEPRELLFYLINFCIRKINEGKEDYVEELLELYAFALEKQLLHVNGRLEQRHFKNIINLTTRLGRHAWAKKFVKSNAASVESISAKATEMLGLAMIEFRSENWAKAAQSLEKLMLMPEAFEDIFTGLDSRGFLCICYLESGRFDDLTRMSNSLEAFVRRNQLLAPARKRGYLQFASAVARVSRALSGNPDKRQEKLAQILKKLDNLPSVPYRKHLISLIQKHQK